MTCHIFLFNKIPYGSWLGFQYFFANLTICLEQSKEITLAVAKPETSVLKENYHFYLSCPESNLLMLMCCHFFSRTFETELKVFIFLLQLAPWKLLSVQFIDVVVFFHTTPPPPPPP